MAAEGSGEPRLIFQLVNKKAASERLPSWFEPVRA
jgi:hypothetical protein